jgi:hypothetical protein
MRRALKSKIAAVALLVYLAANLGAQQSVPTDPASLLRGNMQQRATWATEWLRSSDPQKVAWGAWLAKMDRQVSLIPQLVQKGSEYQSLQEPGEDGAMLAHPRCLDRIARDSACGGGSQTIPRVRSASHNSARWVRE